MVATPVVMDENELFSHIEGSCRVSNVEVLDKENNEYHAIEPDRTYTIASSTFLVEDYGDNGILRYARLKESNLGQDVDMLAIYMQQILGGKIGAEYSDIEGRILIKAE